MSAPDEHAPRIIDVDRERPGHDPNAHAGAGWEPPPPPPFDPPPPRPAATAPKRSGDMRRLRDKTAQFYAGLGMLTVAAGEIRAQASSGDPIGVHRAMALRDAGVNTMQMAEPAADAWIELAQQSPPVRRALEFAMEGSAIGGVVMTNALIAIPYAVALGWLPESFAHRVHEATNLANAAAGNGAPGGGTN